MTVDNAMQTKLLCALASDPDFLGQNVAKLRLADFPSASVRLVFETLRAHWQRYGNMPDTRIFPDEVGNALRGIGPDGQESISTRVPESSIQALAKCVGDVYNALKAPSADQTAYWKDRLKEYLFTVRLAAMPGQDMSAAEQVSEAAKIKEEVESITGGEKRGQATSARKRVVRRKAAVPKKYGTGVWPIDIRMNMGMGLGEVGVVLASSGVGKALVNSDKIPTPDGWRTVGDIKEGDFLFDHTGKPVKVLKVHPQPEKKKVWVVSLADGRKVRCCGEHNWEYWYVSHRVLKSRVETASQIADRAERLGGFSRPRHGMRFWIRKHEAVEYPEKCLPVDPYVVGAAIGNGCLTQWQFVISSGNAEVPNKVAEILGAKAIRKCSKNYNYIFEQANGHHLQNREVLVGSCASYLLGKYSHEKAIPPEYLTASREQRMRLLNGLMDTDGSIGNAKGRVSYSTTSPQLAKDVRELCLSLGFQATILKEGRTRYKSGACYDVRIQCKKSLKPSLFTLTEKKQRAVDYANNGKREEHKEFVAITSIVETDELENMTCFTVDSPEGLFLCGDFVVTHNTNMLINFAVNAALRGQRVLFMTLEVSDEIILRRMHAMMGNFTMSTMDKAEEDWPESSLARYDYMLDKFPNIDYVTVNSEYVSKSPNCDDLDREIGNWREDMRKAGVSDEDAPLVCIDYIRQIDPGNLVNGRIDNTNTKFGAIMQAIKRMAMKHNCVIWTAQQVTRAAGRKEHIRKDDIADSIAIVNHCDVILGFVPVASQTQVAPVTEESEEDTVEQHADKERLMNVDFVKLRNSGETGSFCTVFQGKSLKLWTAEQYARMAENMVANARTEADFDAFFARMRPKEK